MSQIHRKFLQGFAPLILALALLAAGCGKSGDTPEPREPEGGYYMRFKLDGQSQRYGAQAEAQVNIRAGEGYGVNLVGLKDAFIADHNTMALVILHPAPLQPGKQYTNYAPEPGSGAEELQLMSLGYFDGEGKFFMSLSGFGELFGHPADGRVQITALDSLTVSGSFSGTLYDSAFAHHHRITEGSFRLKRLR